MLRRRGKSSEEWANVLKNQEEQLNILQNQPEYISKGVYNKNYGAIVRLLDNALNDVPIEINSEAIFGLKNAYPNPKSVCEIFSLNKKNKRFRLTWQQVLYFLAFITR